MCGDKASRILSIHSWSRSAATNQEDAASCPITSPRCCPCGHYPICDEQTDEPAMPNGRTLISARSHRIAPCAAVPNRPLAARWRLQPAGRRLRRPDP